MTLSVQPQTVTEGAKVLFICSASANPEITGYRYPFFAFKHNLFSCAQSQHFYDDDAGQSHNFFRTLYAAKQANLCKFVLSRKKQSKHADV